MGDGDKGMVCAQTPVKCSSPSTELQNPAEITTKKRAFPGVSGKVLMCKCGGLSHIVESS